MKKKPKSKVKKAKPKIKSSAQDSNGQTPASNGMAKKTPFPLRPLGDRLIVKEIESMEGKKTESGIYIPDTVKEDKGTKRGTVVAAGEGRYEDGKLIHMKIKVGDTVLFSWGDTVTYEGEDYLVIRESEISAIIK